MVPLPRSARIDSLTPQSNQHPQDYRVSRLSPLGQRFIGIPVNDTLRCRHFLDDNPEVLDEDHELYGSEALSALRDGREAEAQSAIEKSIIIRDYDRKRPSRVFRDLSKNVGSAMAVPKERAAGGRYGDPQSRNSNQTLQPTSGVYVLKTRYGDPRPQLAKEDLSFQTLGMLAATSIPLNQITQQDEASRRHAIAFSRNFQVDMDEQATRQNLARSPRALQDLKQEVGITEQELQWTRKQLTAEKQGLQGVQKDLSNEKKELDTIQDELKFEKQKLASVQEELLSTQNALQSHKRASQGSQSHNKISAREREEFDAARELQVNKEGKLRELEKELQAARVALEVEKQCVAREREDFEATQTAQELEDSRVSSSSGSALLSIGVKAETEERGTQTAVDDVFDGMDQGGVSLPESTLGESGYSFPVNRLPQP
jgi:hypothetical protein